VIKFGLCCMFIREPVKFKTFTATSVLKIKKRERIRKISGICLENCESLQLALRAVNRMGIGAFRICSGLFPVYTHPEAGYLLDELPDSEKIKNTLLACRKFAAEKNIRLSFHPDQFIVLSSPNEKVVANSAGTWSVTVCLLNCLMPALSTFISAEDMTPKRRPLKDSV
jgi:UV DNA damage endonuclease